MRTLNSHAEPTPGLLALAGAEASLNFHLAMECGLILAGVLVSVHLLRRLRRLRQRLEWIGEAATPQPSKVDLHALERSMVEASEYRKVKERVELLNDELKKQIEEAEALIDLTPVGIAVVEDRLGHSVHLNRALRELLGLPSEPDLGMTPAPARLRLRLRKDGQEVPTAQLPMFRCLGTGKPVQGEQYELVRGNGETRVVINSARPLFTAAGEVRGCVSVYTDVTEQVRTALALRESEERFRRAFEDSPIGIYRSTPEGRMVMVNPTALKMVGCSSTEEFFQRDPDALGAATSGHPDAITEGEFSWQLPDGRFITVRENVRAVRNQKGEILYFEGTLEDVTRRQHAEQQVREREALFRNIIAHIPCGLFWKDRDGVYLGCNNAFAHGQGIDGPDAILGLRDADLPFAPLSEQDAAASDLQVIESGQPILNVEEVHVRAGGKAQLLVSKVPLRNHAGAVVGVLGTYLDMTEQKRLEEQFLQAQKMEAIGRLAGGIAHDFNNLLTVIFGNADLVQRLPAGSAEHSDRLNDLQDAASRAAGLVRQLLTFSRRQTSRPELVNLTEVLTAMSGMLRRLLGEKVKVVTDLCGDGSRVRVDRVQLEQVIMNLAVNARDAMPAGGTLTLTTRRLTADEFLAGPAPAVELAVADTGCGMSAEVQAKIFEPFFTTKGPDMGTGLGLATVHGIVHQAGGTIGVDSAPGRGTSFRIAFPAAEGPVPASSERPRIAAIAHDTIGRGRTVLLVEDEDAVRTLSRITLESQGYSVIEASDAEAALARLDADQTLDLLVTDLTMPGMDGLELAEAVRLHHPGIGIVFMSGYLPESDPIDRQRRSIFLSKPFSPSQLLEAARRLARLSETPEPATAGSSR